MRRNPRSRNRKFKTADDFDQKKIVKFLSFSVFILIIILTIVATFYYFKNNDKYQKLVETSKQELEDQK